MARFLSPSLTPQLAAEPWLLNPGVNSESVLVAEEAELEAAMNAIRDHAASEPIGSHGNKTIEEEEDTTTLNQDDDVTNDDDTGSVGSLIESSHSETSSMDSM